VAKQQHKTDLLIGGAGFAGLALGLALRQGLGEAFSVTVVDPALAATVSKDPRASAIAAAFGSAAASRASASLLSTRQPPSMVVMFLLAWKLNETKSRRKPSRSSTWS